MKHPMNINLTTTSSEKSVAFDTDSKHFAYDVGNSRQGTKVPSVGGSTSGLSPAFFKSQTSGGHVAGSTKTVNANGRFVAVKVSSNEKTVNLSLKPSVIEREERQKRLNESVKLGFLPAKRSTVR